MAANQNLGRNIVFPLYNSNGTPFHNLVMRKATIESVVMSLGDKITGEVYYKDNTLDVTMHEYIEYNDVKYMLVNPPTVVREGMVSDNSELHGMTKYAFVFYHPMCQLGNFPFSDVAVTSDESRYLSESKTFSWIGKPADFAAKLNKNLQNTVWIVELSSSFPQDKLNTVSDVLSFDNATIADACKVFYETWGVPYTVDEVRNTEVSYSTGKRFKIILGYPSNEIYEDASAQAQHNPFVFRMGQGVGLKNNSRTPRNNKIITRLAGQGSEKNIPYGYPQIRWYGTEGQSFTYGDHAGVYTNVTIGNVQFDKIVSYPIYKGILGGEYVELINHPFTRTRLMPSVYRTTLFNKISFLNEDGTVNRDYDPDITLVDYYDAVYSQSYPYPNEINLQAPCYEAHTFDDDKPELGEAHIVSVTPLNNDLTPASDWDDTIDDDGNFNQSYFQMVLPQLSFDIYACASITEEMKINMRSGACLGCTFTVQVDWEDYKLNFYDENGNFAPNGTQRDLTKYPKSNQGSIALVLMKENTTFGTVLPSVYQQPMGESSSGADDGDTFVVLGISLPESYITTAETKLDGDIKTYMLENNVYYFDYPLKFDEYFLFNNANILSQIRPSTIIRFDYAGQTQALYVKQLVIKYGYNPLPQYDITLTDNIEVVLNQVGQVAGDVNRLAAQLAILHQNYGKNLWEELDKKLSKTRDDVASGQITMLKGVRVGQYRSRFLGSGAAVDPAGNAEFESIYSRSFISTPEFRFNRISVTEGEQWCTNGYGTIESVVEGKDENGNTVTNGGLITLHLEENDFASVAAGDICRGIYNDIAGTYNPPAMDNDASYAAGTSAQEGDGIGFSAKSGFFTSYFYIDRIVKSNKGECQFIYKLRSSTTPHPCAYMKFAQYGSFTDASRRASSYATSIGHYYEMVLEGVRTWTIESANVVYRKGYLGDLVIELADGTSRQLQGYGLYAQNNVYFGNAVIQLDPYTLEMLEEDLSTYDVSFGEHVDMIVVDDTGNVIGGIYTETEEGGVTTREYRIHSAITVRKKGTLLTEALAGAEAGLGTYKINFTPIGCSAMIENSTMYITGIDHVKDGVAGSGDDTDFDYDAMRAVDSCRVDFTIDCEGKTSIQKSIPIAIKHDSQPFVGADITNEFSAVSWNTKTQSYAGLPITLDFKMWHNDEMLDITSVDDISVSPSITGMTVAKSIVENASGNKVAHIVISALPADLGLVTDLEITCVATYSGVRYERTLVHTINKSTDTNVYSLIPSVDEVVVNKNTGGLSSNSVDISVVCDSSDNKHYAVVYNQFGTHQICICYKKFYTNGTSDANETEYTGTAVSVDSSVERVSFFLYKKVGTTIDRTVLHDKEDVPIIANGQDGKGVEYIFITQNTETPVPTINDVAADRQVDNYCPYTDAQHTAQWTDEPTGVASNAKFEFYAQRKKVNGVWQPFGEVKLWNRYVVDGVTPYIIDLSNEQSFVVVDSNGNETYETSRLMLFLGQSYAFNDFAITITPVNITCNNSSAAFTLTAEQKAAAQAAGYYTLTPSAITEDSATITVTATKGNIVLSAVYKINKSNFAYSLITSLDTIRKDQSGSIVSSDATLTLQVKKTVGASASILTTYNELTAEGLSLKYVNADGTTALGEISKATSTLIGSGAWVKIELWKSSVIVDSERINVVFDGDDGDDGSYYVKEYAVGDSRTTAPTSGWGTSQPSPSDGQYVWERSRLYNPNTGTYGSYVYVCLTGKSGTNGARGRMYHIMGEYSPSSPYTLTDDLCPVVYYNGSYYYLKNDSQGGNAPTNNYYWGAASDFEMVFTKALFAAFAQLGGFIVWNNWFISQKGTVGGVADQTVNNNFTGTMTDSGSNFIPYLALDAATGNLYAKKGVIGGFDINSDFLGNTSGDYYTYLSPDGYLALKNPKTGNHAHANGAIYVQGGALIQGDDKHPLRLLNGNGETEVKGNPLNINTNAALTTNIGNGGSTSILSVNSKTTFYEPVSVNTSMAITGLFAAGGNIKISSFTLPESPKIGQSFFCKGVTTDLTVSVKSGTSHVIMASDSRQTVTSLSLQDNAAILVYMKENTWVHFRCD